MKLRRLGIITSAVTVTAALGALAPIASAQAPSANIVETAVAAGQFKTLASLLTSAGLADDLQTKGPFTVFAPTDAAFAKVPKATLNALAKDKKKLRAVLLYHVVGKRLTASQVQRRSGAETLNGARLPFKVRNGKVYVGPSRVTTPDIKTSNGIIHVINSVLIPPSK